MYKYKKMKYDYDIILVGSGPSALSFAQAANHYNDKSILIIDKMDSIGGCHRVMRQYNGLFAEHGPKIYSSNYVTFIDLLSKMDLKFDELYTKYNYPVTSIGNKNLFTLFSIKEYLTFTKEMVQLFADDNYGDTIVLKDFLDLNEFSPDSKDTIDKICRLTDGAGIDKYTMNEFLNLFNQNILYQFYQPKLPNDLGLFKYWQNYLEDNGTEFLLNKEVTTVNKNEVILADSQKITANQIILAIPPLNLSKILDNSNENIKQAIYLKNNYQNYDELKEYLNYTSYNNYINITFHWSSKLDLPKLHGFPSNEWGIFWIVLSDYCTFEESKTVISLGISYLDNLSSNSLKTANESNKEELIKEAFYQLRETYKITIPRYSEAVMSPNVYKKNEIWIDNDTAFFKSKRGYMSAFTKIPSLFVLGTQCGFNFYKFTSMESAVSNGVELARRLYPEIKRNYQVKKFKTVKDLTIQIGMYLSIMIIFIIIYRNLN